MLNRLVQHRYRRTRTHLMAERRYELGGCPL